MPNSVKELNRLLQKNYGYNLVALPSSGIQPLQVLYKKHEGLVGWLKNLFGDTELSNSNSMLNEYIYSKRHPFPQVIKNNVDNDLKNSFSKSLDAEAKVDLLLKVLDDKTLEAKDKNQLKAALKNASNSTFQLGGDAKEVTINHRTLDSFVTGARIQENLGNTFRKRLKGNDLYIVTSVLMSNSFSLTSNNQSEQSLKASFTKLKEVVEASTKIKVKKQDDTSIQFEGEEPIVFAFKAVQLKFDRNEVNEPDFLIQDKTGIVVKSADNEPYTFLKIDFDKNLDL